jgi:hypothetical protein
MSISKCFFFILVSFSVYSQKLHHQMLSSQGVTMVTSSGAIVIQTIGQQSAIGNYRDSNIIVGQGFLQSNKMKTAIAPVITIKTTAYPNPFIDKVNFQFSAPIGGLIKITFFDIMGRVVYSNQKLSVDNILTIDNLSFAQGEYFIKLSAKNFNYSINLLK